MIQLIKIFWDICAVKAAPQDLPTSSFLLGLALLAYFVTGTVVAAFQWPLSQAILAAFLDTVFLTPPPPITPWRSLSWKEASTSSWKNP